MLWWFIAEKNTKKGYHHCVLKKKKDRKGSSSFYSDLRELNSTAKLFHRGAIEKHPDWEHYKLARRTIRLYGGLYPLTDHQTTEQLLSSGCESPEFLVFSMAQAPKSFDPAFLVMQLNSNLLSDFPSLLNSHIFLLWNTDRQRINDFKDSFMSFSPVKGRFFFA